MTESTRQARLVEWLVSCYTPFGVRGSQFEALDGFDGPSDQFGRGKASEASHSQVERPKCFREPSLRRTADKDGDKASQERLHRKG